MGRTGFVLLCCALAAPTIAAAQTFSLDPGTPHEPRVPVYSGLYLLDDRPTDRFDAAHALHSVFDTRAAPADRRRDRTDPARFTTGACTARVTEVMRGTNGCAQDSGGAYARVGMDRQFGSVVIGGLGEFGRTSVVDVGYAAAAAPNTRYARSVDWEGSVRMRAGYAAGRLLVYATGGPGFANLDPGFNTESAGVPTGAINRLGMVAGGGLERRVNRKLRFGIDYAYHHYADMTYPLGEGPSGSAFGDARFQWHSVRANVDYRF